MSTIILDVCLNLIMHEALTLLVIRYLCPGQEIAHFRVRLVMVVSELAIEHVGKLAQFFLLELLQG